MRPYVLLCLACCAFVQPATAQTPSQAPAPSPTVRTFAPTVAPSGALISIVGSHFTGATFVSFNRIPAHFVVNSDTQITAQAPSGNASGPLQVNTPGGIAVSAKSFHLGTPSVSLTQLTPAVPRPGTLARLTGTGLADVKSVQYGGKPARFTVVSDTQISVLVPAGAKTPATVTVITMAGRATLK